MIPHFANPHFLPDSTKTVSRSELYLIDEEDTQTWFTEDPTAVAHLNELLSKKFALVPVRRELNNVVPPACKKRKITELEDTQNTQMEEPILFRLVSSALPPLPVSLLPPPPPPPITREPDVEDNETQARLRQQWAESVSIDAEVILRESLQSLANSRSKVSTMRSKETPRSAMIIRTLQLPRKTRPPVPSSDLKNYPYGSDNFSLNVEAVASKTGNFFTIDAQRENELSTTPRKRGRRRRKSGLKDRPIPQFWRPSSTLTGKCKGYGYGYPSYLASAMGPHRKRYTRDSMKKGILLDNS